MAATGPIKSIDPGRNKLRIQVAAGCFALGLILIFIAVKFQSKEFLTAAVSEKHTDRRYSRMWFDDGDTLTGAAQDGARLTIQRWSGGSVEQRQFDFDAPPEPETRWVMSADLSRLAWISGSKLYSRSLDGEKDSGTVTIVLPSTPASLSLGLLSEGSIDVAFADGKVKRWNGASGQLLGERQLALSEVDQAVTEGDYVAVSSTQAGRLLLYHFRDSKDWMQIEESAAPDPPYRLVIPAPGIMATFTVAGLRTSGKTQNTPGPLHSAASHLDDVIVTGDFDRIVVLAGDGERYPLAGAAPGSLVAAGRNYIAVSGRDGTTMFKLGTENRLTSMGRKISLAGVAALSLAGLFALGPFLLEQLMKLLNWLLRRKRKSTGRHIPHTLGLPPVELVKAFAAGQGGLWAGAGLSAQSGLPARAAFINGVLLAAAMDNWTDAALVRKLQGLCARGAAEEALDQLLQSGGRVRNELAAHSSAVLGKFAACSRSHDLLARIPIAAVITTNYDKLLERAGAPFVLRLYGDLEGQAFLSRAEFRAGFPHSSAAEPVRRTFGEQTLLFLGCSLGGLLADFAVVGAPAKSTHQHFAVAGVSGTAWEAQAAELWNRFGVHVLPCSEDTISSELPAFLQSLVEEVGKLQEVSTLPAT